MTEWLQLLIGLSIIGMVLWAARRSGQANPVGTGRLARRISELEATVAAHGEKITSVEVSIHDLAASAARRSDIEVLRAEVAGDRAVTEKTWHAVERLQEFFIEEAFRRRRE